MRVLLLIAVLCLLPVAAGERAGGLPTPEENTLFAHYLEDPGEWFLSNVKDEPDQYVGGFGIGATCPASPACVPSTSSNTWSVPLDPQPTEIFLDTDGTVHMEAWIGSASKSGRITVTSELLLDGEVIASGEEITDVYNAEYIKFAWDVAPSVDTIAPGSVLQWDIFAEGVHTGMYLRLADSPGWSHIVLPISGNGELPDPPVNATIHESVLEEGGFELSVSNATSDTYAYDWTAPNGTFVLSHNITVAQGEVGLAVLRGNETLFGSNVTEDSAGATPPLQLEPGDYRIVVAFSDFIGNVTVAIDEQVAADGDDVMPGDDGTDTSDETDTNDTPADDQESPGFLIAPLLGLLVLLARRP